MTGRRIARLGSGVGARVFPLFDRSLAVTTDRSEWGLTAEGVRPIDRALLTYGRAFEHPCKIRLVRWLVRRFAAGRIRTKYAAGAIVAVDPHDYVGWAMFRTGAYEPQTLGLALRLMAAEPGLFVDVGAHVGWHTCAVASLAGSNVIAIEPDAEDCSELRTNVTPNRFQNVSVCNVAVGPAPALLALSKRSVGNSGTVTVANSAASARPQNWVACVMLETLLNELVRPPVRPVLLKIDVEGFEPAVLAGLDFDGRFRPKHMLIECDDAFCARSWGSRERFAAFFAKRGYDLFDVTGRPFVRDAALPEANVWARDRREAVS
jgi:FkbM family methyltransferase